jgi:hypothetical protein
MDRSDGLRLSDAAVVARYLFVRSHLNNRLLAQVEALIQDRYDVQPAQRTAATVTTLARGGFVRPGEGELWPVVFVTAVDITLALCLEISPQRIASLGTMLKGPQRLRHRHWEDWWGWETPLAGVHPQFFELPAAAQDDAMKAWYVTCLDWLANSHLLWPK